MTIFAKLFPLYTFRLLEADKRKCKGLTPTHSRTGSTAGSVRSHVRNDSSTSQISVTSSNSQVNDEENGTALLLFEVFFALSIG